MLSWKAVCRPMLAFGTGPARHEADAGPAAQLLFLRLGHEGRALLAAGDEADALTVLVEAVEHGEVALAGNAEDGVDALGDQCSTRRWPAICAVMRPFFAAAGRARHPRAHQRGRHHAAHQRQRGADEYARGRAVVEDGAECRRGQREARSSPRIHRAVDAPGGAGGAARLISMSREAGQAGAEAASAATPRPTGSAAPAGWRGRAASAAPSRPAAMVRSLLAACGEEAAHHHARRAAQHEAGDDEGGDGQQRRSCSCPAGPAKLCTAESAGRPEEERETQPHRGQAQEGQRVFGARAACAQGRRQLASSPSGRRWHGG